MKRCRIGRSETESSMVSGDAASTSVECALRGERRRWNYPNAVRTTRALDENADPKYLHRACEGNDVLS